MNESNGTLGGTGTTTITGTTASTWSGGNIGTSTGNYGVNSTGVTNIKGSLALSGTGYRTLVAGTLNVLGTTTWSGNSPTGNNAIYLGSTTSLATLNNSGSWTDSNAYASSIAPYYGGGTFNNAGTGIYTKDGASVTSVNVEFDNAGTVNLTKGTLALNGGGTASGSFNEASGTTLQVGGGTFTWTGVKMGGPGTFQVAGGQVNQSGTTTESGTLSVAGGGLAVNGAWTAASLNESNGTLGGTGTTTITGTTASTWSGGNIGTSTGNYGVNSTGVTNIKGSLALSGTGYRTLVAGTLNVLGTTTWSGNSPTGNNAIYLGSTTSLATLNNSGSWTDSNAYASSIAPYYGGGTFNNAGTGIYTKDGASVTSVNVEFDNAGTVNLTKGTLALNGGGTASGSFNEASGTTLQVGGGTFTWTGVKMGGPGTFQVAGGQVNQSGTTTESGTLSVAGGGLAVNGAWTAASLNESNGTLGGTGTTTITGTTASTWSGGNIGTSTGNYGVNSTGVTNIKGSLALSGTGYRTLVAGTLNVLGTTTWSGNSPTGNNAIYLGSTTSLATLNNSGSWTDSNAYASSIAPYYGGGTFNNAGTGIYTKDGASVTSVNVEFDNAGTVNLTKGTLALNGGGTASGSFNEASGTTLQVGGGTFTWTGVKMGGPGTFQVAGGQVNQSGTTTESGTLSVAGGGLAVNGTWTAASLNESNGTLGGTGTTTITGTTASTWSGGNIGTSTGNYGVNSTGVTNIKGSLALSGTGYRTLVAGTLNVLGTTTWSGNSPTGNNAIYLGSTTSLATLNNSGSWTDSNAYASSIAPYYGGGTFNNAGTGIYTKDGASVTSVNVEFDNAGTVNLTKGTLALNGGGTASGSFNEASGTTLQVGGGTFTWTGVKMGGPGTFQVAGGQVNQSGTTTESGTLSVAGSGALYVNGTWNAAAYSQTAGTLGGTGTTTVSGASNWTGGDIGTTTGTTIFKGSLSISGNNQKNINGGTLTAAGTTSWGKNTAATDNNILMGSSAFATINNTSTGTWLDTNMFQTSISAPYYNYGAQFNNAGTYSKSGNNQTSIGVAFNNTGTVNVSAGLLALYGGGISTGTFNPTGSGIVDLDGGMHTLTGITVKGNGVFQIDAGSATQTGVTADSGQLSVVGSGTLYVNGTWNAATYSQSGGTLGGTGTTTVSGASNWTGGDIGTTTGTTLFKGSLTISGNNQKNINGGTLTTAGTTSWGKNTAATDNNILMGSSAFATINNTSTGTWLDTNASPTSISTPYYNYGAQFNNSGTYSKSGNSQTTIGIAFNNTGTVNVSAGTLALASLTNYNSTKSTLAGGTYVISGKGILDVAGANVVTNAANIILTGSSAQFLNSSTGGSALANLATNGFGARFAVTGGATFTTLGKFNNSGTLIVGSGSTFTSTGSLTNLSGTTLTSGTYDITGTLDLPGANIVTNDASLALTGSTSQILSYTTKSNTQSNALANFSTNASGANFSVTGGRTFTTLGKFTNSGTFNIGSGSTFTSTGNFANAGSLNVGAGSTFATAANATFTQSAGTLSDNGVISATGGITVSGGSLIGVGTIKGNLQSSGTITPGASPTSTGILTDTGTYTQNASGILDISIGGTTAGSKYDELKATTAKLGGTLNLSLANGFTPTVGSTYKIMGFNSETGQFAKVNGLAINSSEHFVVAYQGSDVLLTVASNAPATKNVINMASLGLMRGGATIDKLRSRELFQNRVAPLRSVLEGPTALTARQATIGRPREGGRMSRANIQFSIPTTFSRPSFGMSVN